MKSQYYCQQEHSTNFVQLNPSAHTSPLASSAFAYHQPISASYNQHSPSTQPLLQCQMIQSKLIDKRIGQAESRIKGVQSNHSISKSAIRIENKDSHYDMDKENNAMEGNAYSNFSNCMSNSMSMSMSHMGIRNTDITHSKDITITHSKVQTCEQCRNHMYKHKQMKATISKQQQQISELKHQYIAMQKKYLLQQKQYLYLLSLIRQNQQQNRLYEEQCMHLREKEKQYEYELQEQEGRMQANNNRIDSLQRQLRDSQDREAEHLRMKQEFGWFISKYQQLAQQALTWSELLNRIAVRELPATAFMIREELNHRRDDISSAMLESRRISTLFRLAQDEDPLLSNIIHNGNPSAMKQSSLVDMLWEKDEPQLDGDQCYRMLLIQAESIQNMLQQ